ncbi:hypothetical protein Gotur_019392, partial [Gossypium turneri]
MPQKFNFGYCECVTQTSVNFSGYVFWECLGGPKFKPGLGQNELTGLVDKWSVGVREVMGSNLWAAKVVFLLLISARVVLNWVS